MIVCHCTRISDHDIARAIDWMRASDPHVIITPGRIYRALGKAAVCGGCVGLFVDKMRANDNLAVPANLRGLNRAPAKEQAPHEGRSESHRLSQQGTSV